MIQMDVNELLRKAIPDNLPPIESSLYITGEGDE